MAADLDTAREANRLYWETETPVAEIAQRLDISRRALYDAVRPLPAGSTCDVCGGELTYENRSARTAGVTVCLQCRTRAEENDDEDTPDSDADVTAQPFAIPALDARTARLGGAMIVGAALGAVATLLVVRR